MAKNSQKLQIFITYPDLQIPTQTLTLNPSQSLNQIPFSFLPKTLTQNNPFFFTFNGKTIPNSIPIEKTKITHLSTLSVRLRLRGGGGDGGSTCAESRDCYLNMYAEKKPDKVDLNEKRLSKWTNCAISNEPLKCPIVIDNLGNVFNKEKLVEAVLNKSLPKEFGHIKGLKDMIDVKMGFPKDCGKDLVFRCPVTDLEFNGKYRFFAIRSCGHVLSAKAFKEVRSEACLVCHSKFSEEDKLAVNGSEEEVAVLRERMREKRGKKKRDVADDVVKADGKRVLKRFKAVDVAPAGATKEVYASIFTSSRKGDFKETYSCRSLPLGRN